MDQQFWGYFYGQVSSLPYISSYSKVHTLFFVEEIKEIQDMRLLKEKSSEIKLASRGTFYGFHGHAALMSIVGMLLNPYPHLLNNAKYLNALPSSE